MTNKNRNEPGSLRSSSRENRSIKNDGNMVGAIWQGGTSSMDAGGSARARFLWTDQESGEKLVLEVQGDEAFFHSLEELGFERDTEGQAPRVGAPCKTADAFCEPADASCEPKAGAEESNQNSGSQDSVNCFPSGTQFKMKLEAPRRSSRLLKRVRALRRDEGAAPWNERWGA